MGGPFLSPDLTPDLEGVCGCYSVMVGNSKIRKNPVANKDFIAFGVGEKYPALLSFW
jgi:hypothetical protein